MARIEPFYRSEKMAPLHSLNMIQSTRFRIVCGDRQLPARVNQCVQYGGCARVGNNVSLRFFIDFLLKDSDIN